MVSVGDLDQIVMIEEKSGTPDGYGGFSMSWSVFGRAWARVEPIRGREQADRGAVREIRQYMLTMHKRTDLTNDMVISWQGQRFNIRNIKVPTPRDQFMDVIVEAGGALD